MSDGGADGSDDSRHDSPGGVLTVADVGEDTLVAQLLRRLAAGRAGVLPRGVSVTAGDDAAVLAAGDGRLVLSTDTLVSGVDFRLDWSSAADVGIKTAAQNLADIAAMGAPGVALLVSLTMPGSTPVAWVLGLADGLAEECGRAGAAVIGGDVSAGGLLVVTGTAVGMLPAGARPVLRSGARPGDVVAVAGVLGESAAGLALLQAGVRPPPGPAAAAIASHLRPRPPYSAGPAAAGAGAGALIDLSDGLVRDARRVAQASAVTIDLDPRGLGPSAVTLAAAALLDVDPTQWVLAGGEDHSLLATFDPRARMPAGFRSIGRVIDGDGDILVAGTPYVGAGGYTHWDA